MSNATRAPHGPAPAGPEAVLWNRGSMLARGLAVLDSFRPGESSLSLSQLARRCHLPIATVHRLVAELAASGFLDSGAGGIRLGPGLAYLGLRGPWHDLFWRLALEELGRSAAAPASLLTLSARRADARIPIGALWEDHGYVVVSIPPVVPPFVAALDQTPARGSGPVPARIGTRAITTDGDAWALEVTRARLAPALAASARRPPAPVPRPLRAVPSPGPVAAEASAGPLPSRPEPPAADLPARRTSMLSRGLEVLRSIPPGVPAVSLSELTRRCGLPKSTTHRLVTELAAAGMLEVAACGLRIGPGLMVSALQVPALRRLVTASLPLQLERCAPDRVIDLWVHDSQSGYRLTSIRTASSPRAPAALGVSEAALLHISARTAATDDTDLYPLGDGLFARRLPLAVPQILPGATLVEVVRPGFRAAAPALAVPASATRPTPARAGSPARN